MRAAVQKVSSRVGDGFIALLQKLDKYSFSRLQSHQDKILHIELIDIRIEFYCQVHDERIKILSEQPDEIACHIQGKSIDLLRLINATGPLSQFSVTLSGDAFFAKDFFDCFKSIDIDVEGLAAKLVGDTLAHQLGKGFSSFRSMADTFMHERKLDISEYLTEESRLLPTEAEVERYFKQISQLRHDVDRLEAKLKHLAPTTVK